MSILRHDVPYIYSFNQFHAPETVLLVEYGYFDDNPAQLDPSSSANYPLKDLFNVTILLLT